MQGVNLCSRLQLHRTAQSDNSAGRFDSLSERNKLQKAMQNFQEERESCDQHSMALCDRNITAGGKSVSTL
jgi:hypothetical protein